MLILFGEAEWKRAYYQCQMEKEGEAQECSHGRCPSDEVWGKDNTWSAKICEPFMCNTDV